MFPGVHGFQWDAGHVVFLGVFYSVLFVIVGTVITATRRSLKDVRTRKVDAIRWKTDFEDLPESARRCRHEFTGEYRQRVCENEFDCRSCPEHAKLTVRQGGHPPVADPAGELVYGFSMPSDRYYHRGHTWVRPEPDGAVTIGLDDLGRRIAGRPDAIDLPSPGSPLQVNGTGWHVRKKGAVIRILSPVDGTVVETGSREQGWYLRVKASEGHIDLRHLLRGPEVKPWIMREMERLQRILSAGTIGPSLADGGVPVDDFTKGYPKADWDDVWGEMFLEP